MLTGVSDSLIFNDFKVLEDELNNVAFIDKIAITQTYPGDSFDNLPSFKGIVLPNGLENKTFYTYHAQPDYFDLVGISFVAGKTFIPSASGSSNQVVVNETFLKEMGIHLVRK